MSRVDDVRFVMFSRSHHLLYCLPYVDLVIDDCSLLSPLLVCNVLYCTRLCFRGVITYCSAYLTLLWFLTRVLSFLRYWYVTYCTVPDCVWTILRSVFAYGTAYVDSVLDVYAHSISSCFCVFFVPTSTYGRCGTTCVPSTMRMLSGTLMWYCVRSTACVTFCAVLLTLGLGLPDTYLILFSYCVLILRAVYCLHRFGTAFPVLRICAHYCTLFLY